MDNLDRYRICTAKADWQGICEINGVSFAPIAARKELSVLSDYLEPDEVVFALAFGVIGQSVTSNAFDFGLNSWVVALTSERFLFLDAAMLTSSVDSQSVRLNKVQAISASQGLALGKIAIDLGSRMITINNCTKDSVKAMADLANRWLRELEGGTRVPEPSDETRRLVAAAQENRLQWQESDEEQEETVSCVAASLVTFFLGEIGLNDFIWGHWWCGAIKFALNLLGWRLYANGHYVPFFFIVLLLAVWVFLDLLRIIDGSFFNGRRPAEMPNALAKVLKVVFIANLVIAALLLLFAFSDLRKRDNGKQVSVMGLVAAYDSNKLAAERRFDGPRFTISGAVRSIDKSFWGTHTVLFEGLGPLNIWNLGSNVQEVKLTFSEKDGEGLLNVRRGDAIEASCIGRGLSLGTFSADKCRLKAIHRRSTQRQSF